MDVVMGPARQNDVAGLMNVTLTSNWFFSFSDTVFSYEEYKMMSNDYSNPLVLVRISSY